MKKKIIRNTILFLVAFITFNPQIYAMPLLTQDEIVQELEWKPEQVTEKITNLDSVEEESITASSDVMFVFNGTSIRTVENEAALSKWIDQVNDGTIPLEQSSWYAAGLNSFGQGQEYVISQIDGKKVEGVTYIYEKKEEMPQIVLEELLGEPYDASMQDLLFLGADMQSPLPSPTVVKRFEDGSIKVGLLANVDVDKVHLEKGWHTLAELQEAIAVWNEDAIEEGGMFGGGTVTLLRPEWIVVVLFGVVGVAVVVRKKKVKG